MSPQVDLIMPFAKRSILTGYEYSRPFHLSYYDEINRRTHDLLRAQYSSDPAEVRQFIEQYGVTDWLLNKRAYTREYITHSTWIQQTRPEATAALASLQSPDPPIVARLASRCEEFVGEQVVLLDAACLKLHAADSSLGAS